ncbi:hypothetical protein swp_3630 [Shewanella piezotolerans WP3]|uniref:Uncharacterized protein n=1 Tax=Shewanella piezotolerans (strain WP3 / JCM 13877) TaxID=225849 RepID=B8CS30_SHEPW|nr:hypothetical protein swp_3630 [Shewanella piezotolerans WP3]
MVDNASGEMRRGLSDFLNVIQITFTFLQNAEKVI